MYLYKALISMSGMVKFDAMRQPFPSLLKADNRAA